MAGTYLHKNDTQILNNPSWRVSRTCGSCYPWVFPRVYLWVPVEDPDSCSALTQAVHKKKLSDAEHKKLLLMYHDKRFQTDDYFPIIAFNHEQLKAGTTESFLLARCRN